MDFQKGPSSCLFITRRTNDFSLKVNRLSLESFATFTTQLALATCTVSREIFVGSNFAKIYYFYSLYWISVKLVADRVTKTTNRIFFAVSQCCLTNKTRCTNGNCSVYKNGSSTVPYKNAQIIIPMSRVWNPISQKFVLTKLEKSKFCENFKPYGTLKVIKSTCGKSTVKLWTAALVELVPNLARNFKIEPFAN